MTPNQELVSTNGRLPPSSVLMRGQTFAASQAEPLNEADHEGVVAYWRVIVRHRWTVVFVAALGLITAVLVTLPQTPVYQSRASLEVQGLNENFLDFKELNPNSNPAGYVDPTYEIMTEVKILQSRSLLDKVTTKMEQDQNIPPMVSTDRLAAWRKLLGLPAKRGVSREDAIGAAAGSVNIKATGTTRIIEITTDSIDPRVAAGFANTLVEEFVQKNLDDRWKTTERTGVWLAKQLDDLKIKLERSEDSLQAYATATGLQFTGSSDDPKNARENVADSALRQMQEELLKARAERVSVQSKSDLLATSQQQSLPQVADNASLQQYQMKLTDLRTQLADLSTSLNPEHPKVLRVQAQITALEAAFETERRNVIGRLKNDYQATMQREKLLDQAFQEQSKTVTNQSAKLIHYNILKREVDTNRQLYETMLGKVKESAIASAMRASNFRVVDAAVVPSSPYKPNMMNNAMLGSMAGLFFGIVVVMLRERADRSIQQPGDSSLYLGIAELGVIPSERSMALGKATSVGPARIDGRGGKESNLALVTWDRQQSLMAECFRAVLTSIMFSENGGKRPRVLVVASPNPSEGKTTVASNLAIALAEINEKVILIDADMRRPRAHKIFSLENNTGLSTLLSERHSIDAPKIASAIRETAIPGLHVMTAGPMEPSLSTLLYSARLREIIDTVHHGFDTVVIDSPPMLHIADARLLARHADCVLLVLRAGKTTRAAALAARQKFQADGSNILGTILTDWNPDQNGYSYDYKYYSNHAEYYTSAEPTNTDSLLNQ